MAKSISIHIANQIGLNWNKQLPLHLLSASRGLKERPITDFDLKINTYVLIIMNYTIIH